MALTLGLAGLRNVGAYARATHVVRPGRPKPARRRVTILGGGGITESLVRLLAPWDATSPSSATTPSTMDGVDEVLESDRFADALPGADLVVLALALTPETDGLFGARRVRR